MEKCDVNCEEMERTLLDFCRQRGFFEPCNRVIAACSGGADSMALVLFLQKYKVQLGITLEVCHVNHGLRETADRDEAFVRDYCHKQGLLLHLLPQESRMPPPAGAGENWARQLRYSFFESLCAGDETACIATAHTMSDQAETVLFRMARGTGVHGLCGIPAVRGVFRRPMLAITRAQTEALCAAAGQEYVTDETNLSDDYARNRIRHHAVPALETANPQAVRAISRMAEKMGGLDAYFAAKAATLLQKASAESGTMQEAWRLETLAGADEPVLQWALHTLISRCRDAEEKYIRLLMQMVKTGSGALQLTETVRFAAGNGLLFYKTDCFSTKKTEQAEWELAFSPGDFELPGGYVLHAETANYEHFEKIGQVHKKDLNCLADYDKIQNITILRTRRPGDFFSPAGRGVTKSLKKLYNELEIPLCQRSLTPLLAQGSRVVWLWGQGFCSGVAPTEGTKTILRISNYQKGE